MTDDTVLDLIKHIYEAVGDSRKWNAFLDKLAAAIRAKTATIAVFDKSKSHGNLMAIVGADPENQRKYDEYYSAIDSWYQNGKHLLTTSNVVTGQMLCPDRVLERSEFYNDFLKPIDDYHEICGVISNEKRLVSMLTCMRAERHGPFEEEERRVLRILMPHLQTAVQLHRKMVTIENQRVLAETALDHLEFGLLVLNVYGGVLAMNRAARVICERDDGLVVTRDGLRARKGDEQRRLTELLRSATVPTLNNSSGWGGGMKISRPSLKRPFHVLVGPLQVHYPWPNVKEAAVLVCVTDPDAQAFADAELLENVFGLTPAESRLAAGIMQGKSLTALAEAFRLTRNTVHTQLQRVFEKTGTHRQSELIRLLLMGSIKFRASSQK